MQSTRRHLTKKLEVLDLKVEEHYELSQLIANDVRYVDFLLSLGSYIFQVIPQNQ